MGSRWNGWPQPRLPSPADDSHTDRTVLATGGPSAGRFCANQSAGARRNRSPRSGRPSPPPPGSADRLRWDRALPGISSRPQAVAEWRSWRHLGNENLHEIVHCCPILSDAIRVNRMESRKFLWIRSCRWRLRTLWATRERQAACGKPYELADLDVRKTVRRRRIYLGKEIGFFPAPAQVFRRIVIQNQGNAQRNGVPFRPPNWPSYFGGLLP